MLVKLVKKNKRLYLPLLLLADEDENMISKYIDKGMLFLLYDKGLKTSCLVTKENNYIYEIKNLATYEIFQGQGYAKKMLNFIFSYYNGKIKTLVVGTGDSPLTLPFYEKCGFSFSHKIDNFFTDNYKDPIIEAGVLLRDMIYLKKDL